MARFGRKSGFQVAAVVVLAAGAGAAIAGRPDGEADNDVRVDDASLLNTTTTAATTTSVVVSGSTSVTSSPPLVSDVVRVAIIGDEYTATSGNGSGSAEGWATTLEQSLRNAGRRTEFTLEVAAGAGYARAGSTGSTFEDLVPDAIFVDTQAVVIFGSRNDFGLDSEAIGTGARATLQQIRNLLPTIPIFLVGPVTLPDDFAPVVPEISRILGVVAVEYEATFIDPSTEDWFADDPTMVGRNGNSPTTDGQTRIAEKVQELLDV